MDWKALNSETLSLDDKPRILTELEINQIIDKFPKISLAESAAAQKTWECVTDWIKSTLKETAICPSAVPELIKILIEQHRKSLVVPKTPVGITAAESVGATITQATLNTFHSSGSAKSASFGINAIRDLIFAGKNPKNESTTIYFTNKTLTYEEVLNLRAKIVGSVVADFVSDYDFLKVENIPDEPWYLLAVGQKKLPQSELVLRLKLNLIEMFKHKVKISDLARSIEADPDYNVVTVYSSSRNAIIDVYPDPNLISTAFKKRKIENVPIEYEQMVFLETIVQPGLANVRVKGISGIRALYPIVSPVWRIVGYERKINEITWELLLNKVIMKSTGITAENLAKVIDLTNRDLTNADGKNLITKHYDGMKVIRRNAEGDVLSVKMPLAMLKSQRGEIIYLFDGKKYIKINKSEVLEVDGRYYREIDSKNLKPLPDNKYNFEIDDGTFINISREQIVERNQTTYFLFNPFQFNNEYYYEFTYKSRDYPPSEYLTDQVNIDKSSHKALLKFLSDQKRGPDGKLTERVYVERTPLMKGVEFIIADTDGINFRETLAFPGVDKERTTCNNMHKIAETLGIEATRNFIIKALNDTIINTGSYVNPAHITLIAEFITSRGEPFGATYTGVARQPVGHLSLATLERAGNVFVQSALRGRSESTRNVSASVTVGSRMVIGNGGIDVGQKIGDRILVNEDLFTAVTPNKVTVTETDIEEMLKTIVNPNDLATAEEEKGANLLKIFGEGFDKRRMNKEPKRIEKNIVVNIQPTTVSLPHLVDILDSLKSGKVPLKEVSAIRSLLNNDSKEIESRGLFNFGGLPPIVPISNQLPAGLQELLDRYFPKNVLVLPAYARNVPLASLANPLPLGTTVTSSSEIPKFLNQ